MLGEEGSEGSGKEEGDGGIKEHFPPRRPNGTYQPSGVLPSHPTYDHGPLDLDEH